MSESATSVGSQPFTIRRAHAWALQQSRAHVWSLTVCAAMAVYTVAVFGIVRDHYLHFRIGRYDLGNMVQAVWSTTQGRPLEMTDGATGEQTVRLAFHVDPILALLAPLWMAVPTPLTLVAVQVVAIALGALPLFWLARRHLGSQRAAALLAIAYLLYPWTAWAGIDVFHPLSLALPLLLYATWFLSSDRLSVFAVFAVLAAATGELVGLTLAALGVWYALERGRRAAGAAIAAAGLAWTLVAVLVVVPAFAGESSVFYGAYEEVGGSPWGLVETAFTDPLTIVSAATRVGDLAYVGLIAVPLAGAFVLAPALAAVALPQLGLNVLADFGATTDVRSHYVAPVLPFLFAAVVLGLGRLDERRRERGALVVLTAAVAASVMLGPWSSTSIGTPEWFRVNSSPEAVAARRDALALVPDDAAVAATNTLGAHLASRAYLSSVPTVGLADWVVVDAADPWRPLTWGGVDDPDALRALLEKLDVSPTWRRVFDVEGIRVYRRASR